MIKEVEKRFAENKSVPQSLRADLIDDYSDDEIPSGRQNPEVQEYRANPYTYQSRHEVRRAPEFQDAYMPRHVPKDGGISDYERHHLSHLYSREAKPTPKAGPKESNKDILSIIQATVT